ncbi:hypothetical protein QJQ45_015954 [Haematococcus lacustris]|nr:hypothetical protein QJQ45_015954 [Haematococcus lacustris]
MHRGPKVKKLRARTASACEEAAQDPKAADQGDDNQGPSAAGVKRLGASIKAPALASSKAIAPKAVGTKLKCKRSRVSPTGHAAWLNSYPKVSRWAAQYNLQQLLNQHSSSGRHLLSPMRCMFSAALQSLSTHLPGCAAGLALAALPLPLPLVGSAAGLLRLAGGGVLGPGCEAAGCVAAWLLRGACGGLRGATTGHHIMPRTGWPRSWLQAGRTRRCSTCPAGGFKSAGLVACACLAGSHRASTPLATTPTAVMMMAASCPEHALSMATTPAAIGHHPSTPAAPAASASRAIALLPFAEQQNGNLEMANQWGVASPRSPTSCQLPWQTVSWQSLPLSQVTELCCRAAACLCRHPLADLERLPEKQWLATAASRDLAHNNIRQGPAGHLWHSSSGRHLLSPMRCVFSAALKSRSTHLPGCGAGLALAALPCSALVRLLRLAGWGVLGPGSEAAACEASWLLHVACGGLRGATTGHHIRPLTGWSRRWLQAGRSRRCCTCPAGGFQSAGLVALRLFSCRSHGCWSFTAKLTRLVRCSSTSTTMPRRWSMPLGLHTTLQQARSTASALQPPLVPMPAAPKNTTSCLRRRRRCHPSAVTSSTPCVLLACSCSHEFWSVRSAKGLDAVFRALSLLLPGELHSFSAAKYCRKCVLMDDGAVVSRSRNIALIVYLTRDWQPEYGGLLLDLEAPGGTRTYVPEFNSAIAFRIPRWHAVTPMTTDRPRYSLFGWWLEPGHKYDLQLRPSPSHAPAAAATGPGQAVTQEGENT